jgi:hypothetical protein
MHNDTRFPCIRFSQYGHDGPGEALEIREGR